MKIKEFYINESRWCQDSFGVDKMGRKLEDISEIQRLMLKNIKSLCLYGALCKFYPNPSDRVVKEKLIRDTLRIKKGDTISAWNSKPDRTFDEVQVLMEYLDI